MKFLLTCSWLAISFNFLTPLDFIPEDEIYTFFPSRYSPPYQEIQLSNFRYIKESSQSYQKYKIYVTICSYLMQKGYVTLHVV